MKLRPGLALTLAVGLSALGGERAAAGNKVFLSNGREIAAKSVQWRAGAQEYRVETPEGTIMPFAKTQIDHLEIDKPAEYEAAARAVAAGQFDTAIPLLDALVAQYAMLVWDNEARRLLALAHMGRNDPQKAARTLEDYFAAIPRGRVPSDVQLLYWNALLAAGRAAPLKKDLDEVVATGPRELAAAAQVMRGNLARQAGQKEAALLDYLRVVILFENVKAVQPEALFRAAELLEELRDARAETFRRTLMKEYRDSEWAGRLSGKT